MLRRMLRNQTNKFSRGEVFQANPLRLVKMDTNILQWNIRGLKSNIEDLKLLLTELNIPVVALQDCKIGGEQSSLGGYALRKGNCPTGEAALLISKRVVHTELTIDTHLHTTVVTITLGKTFTICFI